CRRPNASPSRGGSCRSRSPSRPSSPAASPSAASTTCARPRRRSSSTSLPRAPACPSSPTAPASPGSRWPSRSPHWSAPATSSACPTRPTAARGSSRSPTAAGRPSTQGFRSSPTSSPAGHATWDRASTQRSPTLSRRSPRRRSGGTSFAVLVEAASGER
ncbi:MAG: Transcriptional regulator, MarR family, partial [uncultured Solirubrobacteraceae bacterium]